MFRFSIREMLMATVVFALGIGWWLEHSRSNHATWENDILKWKVRAFTKLLQVQGTDVDEGEDGATITVTTADSVSTISPTTVPHSESSGIQVHTRTRREFSN